MKISAANVAALSGQVRQQLFTMVKDVICIARLKLKMKNFLMLITTKESIKD